MAGFYVPYTNLELQNSGAKLELTDAFSKVLDSGNYIQGPSVRDFEEKFAEYCAADFATGIANGTCSLHLLLRELGVREGDEVITAPNSFFASAAAISLAGGRIVFADVGADMNLDPSAVEAAITPRTKGILPVHLTGRPADMVKLQEIATAHSLFILEDAAQAVGSSYFGQKVGSWGDAASFSLHPLKSLHAFGDAGIVTSNNEKLIEGLNRRKNHGLLDRSTCADWSFNCRLDELQAALLLVQLRSLDERISERRRLAQRYNVSLDGIATVPTEAEGEFHTYQTYMIQVDRRDEVLQHLRESGVEATVHYSTPLHLQPAARELNYAVGSFPMAESLSSKILSLPLFPGMTEHQQDFGIEKLLEYTEG